MATNITPATTKVTTSIRLVLDGVPYTITDTSYIDNVTVLFNEVFRIPAASQIKVFSFGATGQGQLAGFKIMLIRNRDALNYVRLRMNETGLDAVDLKIDAGKAITLTSRSFKASGNNAAFDSFANIDEIYMQASAADVDVQILILN